MPAVVGCGALAVWSAAACACCGATGGATLRFRRVATPEGGRGEGEVSVGERRDADGENGENGVAGSAGEAPTSAPPTAGEASDSAGDETIEERAGDSAEQRLGAAR